MRRSAVPLAILHLVGNALILWLGYYWLGITESNGAHLVWSALVVLLFLFSALWLHGTAFAVFNRTSSPSFAAAARTVAHNLLALFVLALIAILIYWALATEYNKFGHKAFVIASYITLHLRKPASPKVVLACYHGILWALEWLIVPALLLPLAANIALTGWHGYRFRSLRRSGNILYWVEVCALLLIAIWVPLRLVHWTPELPRFNAQMASFLARFAVGYLLFVTALLSLEYFTSGGKPLSTQPSTAASP